MTVTCLESHDHASVSLQIKIKLNEHKLVGKLDQNMRYIKRIKETDSTTQKEYYRVFAYECKDPDTSNWLTKIVWWQDRPFSIELAVLAPLSRQ